MPSHRACMNSCALMLVIGQISEISFIRSPCHRAPLQRNTHWTCSRQAPNSAARLAAATILRIVRVTPLQALVLKKVRRYTILIFANLRTLWSALVDFQWPRVKVSVLRLERHGQRMAVFTPKESIVAAVLDKRRRRPRQAGSSPVRPSDAVEARRFESSLPHTPARALLRTTLLRTGILFTDHVRVPRLPWDRHLLCLSSLAGGACGPNTLHRRQLLYWWTGRDAVNHFSLISRDAFAKSARGGTR